MSTDTEAPYGRDAQGNPLPAPASAPTADEIAAKDDEIAQLRPQLADAQATAPATVATAAPVVDAPATSSIGATAPAVEAAESEPVVTLTQAIAPGTSGDEVRRLAELLEAAGEKTYLTDATAQNYAHVFGDDLMDAVRRVLHDHPEIAAAEGAERQRLNRWINGLEVVTGEVWKLIGDVADKAAPAA